jgi:hypothetical protein
LEREIEMIEVSVRDLSRDTSSVLARARRGSRIIVLRHGGFGPTRGLAERRVLLVYAVLSKAELMRRFMGPDIHRRWRNRRLGRTLHGRS